MALEFDEIKIRKKLLKLYRDFIKDPENEGTISELIKFDRDYGRAGVLNEHLESQPIPSYLVKAIGHVSTIFQYGLGTYDNDWILNIAKETLRDLETEKS